ncbi:MAG: hypothetical protein H3Z53_06665 [archaeon]|nr:hypothetical protein [archaeon]MCP8314038.1 hypothetical protein [archaeon]MCP8315663.1 hypothetical protein [archaeon]MCP8320405.1 hypothetical protein [archaeon]
MVKEGWIALGYAVMFYVSLALAIAGAIMFFTGFPIVSLLWIYGGCLAAFSALIATDLAYTFHKKRSALVEVEVPTLVPEEKAVAPVARAKPVEEEE